MKELTHAEYQALLRKDLTSFIERCFHELNPQTKLSLAAYIRVMASKLEACRLGKCKRLIINLPPRHLKSITVSIAFVAWLLGHDPSLQIICASYGQDLSDDLARKCRNIMNSDFYKTLFATRLADRNAVHDFMTMVKGFRMATSVGGVLTGRGGDFIIIDDPIKPDQALSESGRKAVNDWYDNTLLTRLNDKNTGCIIIVMQRLHQDDLVGHVLEQEDWDVLSFPAIAETDETHVIESPMGNRLYIRKEGELLDPTRESHATLNNIRQSMSEYNFSSQYQQNPMPPGGAIVKPEWFRTYSLNELPEYFDYKFQSWDTANKASELNNYSVCTTWGVKGERIYLLDVFRKRLEYPDLKRAVHEQAGLHQVSIILIEDKASGTQLIQELETSSLSGVRGCKTDNTEKEMRLRAQTALIEAGFVFIPKEAHWLAEYIRELISFPGSKYDDQVDSTAQALNHFRNPVPGLGYIEYYKKLARENGF